MRAAVVQDWGQAPVVDDVPEPAAGAGELLVEIAVAALNPLDLLVASGRFPAALRPPYVAGLEGVGRVVAGDGFAPGTRVRVELAPSACGCLAERVAVDTDRAVAVPDGVGDAAAASAGIAGVAAWLALTWRGELQRGEAVVVLGATGAVGQAAVQLARLLGAGRVVAAGRDEGALERAVDRGADATVVLRAGEDVASLAERLTEAAGGPVDLVIDPLWGEPAVAAMRALRPLGRLVNLGQAAGATVPLASGDVRRVSILGHASASVPRALGSEAYRAVAGHVASGALAVDHELCALDDVAAAWRRQAESPNTKLAVAIGPGAGPQSTEEHRR